MSQQSQPFVSVVTPFYNTADFLAQCIESVLAQSYGHFEFVLVNNCSTDGSLEIAEDYARRNSRIRVVQNSTFLRQCENYNHALRQISPRSAYCKVVQADDRLFPTCLSRMVETAEAHPSAGIVGAYTLLDFGTHTVVYLTGLPYSTTFTTGREVCRRFLLRGTYVFGSPTATLFRSEIVRSRDPFYDVASVIEDVTVCFDVLQSWDFGFVHEVLTYTRRYNESAMSVLRGYHLMALTELLVVCQYGSVFLEREEHARRSRAVRRAYRELLGESVLEGRPKAFWDFHQRGLSAIGERFSRLSLAAWAGRALIGLALNPQRTAQRLLRRRTKSSPANLAKLQEHYNVNVQ